MSDLQRDETGEPRVTTIDGGTDFSRLGPEDTLVSGPKGGRQVLVSAGAALTSDRQPMDKAPDGGVERLDGLVNTKLGGGVIGVSVSNSDLHK